MSENNKPVAEHAPSSGPSGDTICQECGRANPCWFADNEVWNAVVPTRTGVLCPTCFLMKADPIVKNCGWKITPDTGEQPSGDRSFVLDLAAVINRYSKENGCDTPDFILADFLGNCLHAFDDAVEVRQKWHGASEGERSAGKPDAWADADTTKALDAMELDFGVRHDAPLSPPTCQQARKTSESSNRMDVAPDQNADSRQATGMVEQAGTNSEVAGQVERLVKALEEAERRLKIIAELSTVKQGEYIVTAGAVMQELAKEYFSGKKGRGM